MWNIIYGGNDMIYSEEKRHRLFEGYLPERSFVILEGLWESMRSYQTDIWILADEKGYLETQEFKIDYARTEELEKKAGEFFDVLKLPPFDEYIAMYEEIRTMTEKYQDMLEAEKVAI